MKGPKVAASYLRKMKPWMEKRRNRYETKEEYADAIMPVYRGVMEFLSGNARKIMYGILVEEGQGITPTKLARYAVMDVNTVTAVLWRLHKSGLVDRTKKGRESFYFCPVEDMYLACNIERYKNRHVASRI